MIVVDTNIIAYLYLPTEFTAHAEELLQQNPEWAAPLLWRSEFRNILAGFVRRKMLTLDQAIAIQHEAEALLNPNEHLLDSADDLHLVNASDCTAYDCEFVALAQQLGTTLYTQDAKLLRAFPHTARALAPSRSR